jgi:hypothetical protein
MEKPDSHLATMASTQPGSTGILQDIETGPGDAVRQGEFGTRRDLVSMPCPKLLMRKGAHMNP